MRGPKRFPLLLPLFSATTLWILVPSCSDDVVLGPIGPPSRHAVGLIDSSLQLAAVYLPGATTPSVQLSLGVSLRIQADSAKISQYTIAIGAVSKQYFPLPATLTFNSLYSISLNETLSGIVPFVSKPTVILTVQTHSFVAGIESTFVFTYTTQRDLNWSDVHEPELREPAVGGRQLTSGEILWSDDQSGFYFHSVQNAKTVICFISKNDSSVTDVSPIAESYRAYDITHDNASILVASDVGTPSGLSLTNRSSFLPAPVIPAFDSLLITSARFSTDDSSIVCTTAKVEPVITQYDFWLVRRNGSPPAKINQLSGFLSPHVLRWLPNSNDKFVFHTYGASLYVYSLTDKTISTFSFSSPMFPRQLLNDGFTVLSSRVEALQGSTVAESHLWKYTLTNQPVRQLTFVKEVVFDFSLSPDGRLLSFLAQRNGNLKLFLLPVTGLFAKRAP